MNEMPYTFTIKGQQHIGYFSPVNGAGSTSVFHLTVNRRYWGRLRFSEFNDTWRFDCVPGDEELEKLIDDFEFFVISWYS